mgnify:CR=1 FL=1
MTITGVADVGAAVKFWFDYNKGIEEATRLTKQFTDLDGADLKNFRADVQAVADTFGKDFADVLTEAKNKSKQLGITMQESLQKVTEEYIKTDGANNQLVTDLVKSNSELERSIADVFDSTDGLFEVIKTNGKIIINKILVKILNGLKSLVKWITNIWDENEWLRKSVGTLATFTINAIQTIIKGLKAIGVTIKNVATMLNPVNWFKPQKMKEALNNIGDAFADFGKQAKKTFTDIFDGTGADRFNKKIEEFAKMGKGSEKPKGKKEPKDILTYIELLQKKLDAAQKKLNSINPLRTDPKEIERRKAAVKVLEDEIKKFNILISSESTLQRIQREREEAQRKLETLADNNANEKDLEAQKQIIIALDEQKKAYEDKISLASEYERLTNNIAREQEKLNKMSLTASEDEIRAQLEKIRLLEIEKAKRDEIISNNSFSGQLKAYTDYSKEILKIEQDRQNKIDAINKSKLTDEEKKKKINSVNKFSDYLQQQAQSDVLSDDAAKSIVDDVAKEMKYIVGLTADELNKKIILLKGKISELKKVGSSTADAKLLSELENSLEICINQFQKLQDTETETASKTSADEKKWKNFAINFCLTSSIYSIYSSQFIHEQHIRQASTFNYHLPNIAIGILAKSGGIPWRLQNHIQKELIIGFNQIKNNDNKFIGSSVFFTNEGVLQNVYAYPEKSSESEMISVLRTSILEYIRLNKDIHRLVIHYYKTQSERESKKIEQLLYDELHINIPYAIVEINDSKSQMDICFDADYNMGMPISGSYVNLGKNEYLLFNNTRHIERPITKVSDELPIKVKIHFADNGGFSHNELISQIYEFSRLIWKGLKQRSQPATTIYAKLIAEFSAHFGGDIPQNDITLHSPWFI